jgi:hypothetical protein
MVIGFAFREQIENGFTVADTEDEDEEADTDIDENQQYSIDLRLSSILYLELDGKYITFTLRGDAPTMYRKFFTYKHLASDVFKTITKERRLDGGTTLTVHCAEVSYSD